MVLLHNWLVVLGREEGGGGAGVGSLSAMGTEGPVALKPLGYPTQVTLVSSTFLPR